MMTSRRRILTCSFSRSLLVCLCGVVCHAAIDYNSQPPDLITTLSGGAPIHQIVATTAASEGNRYRILAGGRNELRIIEQQGDGGSWSTSSVPGSWGNIQAISAEEVRSDSNKAAILIVAAQEDATASLRVGLVGGTEAGIALQETILLSGGTVRLSNMDVSNVVAHDVQLVDWNEDGNLDVLATVSGQSGGQDVGFLVLIFQLAPLGDMEGNTLLRFATDAPAVLDDDLGGISRLRVADLNLDGRVDVAVLSTAKSFLKAYYQSLNPNPNVIDYLPVVIDDALPEASVALTVGDINNRCNFGLDIFVMSTTDMTAFLCVGRLQYFRAVPFSIPGTALPAATRNSYQVEFFDLDQDALTDLIMIFGLQTDVYWSPQVARSTMSVPITMVSGITEPDAFVLADINQDGILDVVVHSQDTGQVVIAYATGDFPTTSPPSRPPAVGGGNEVAPPVPAPFPAACRPLFQQCSSDEECCQSATSTPIVCKGVCKKDEIEDPSRLGGKLFKPGVEGGRDRGGNLRRQLPACLQP